jgi:hypothetical protein
MLRRNLITRYEIVAGGLDIAVFAVNFSNAIVAAELALERVAAAEGALELIQYL